MDQDSAERLADAGAATAVLIFGGLTLTQWGEVSTILAGLGAFFGGIAAGLYHIKRWWILRREVKAERAEED
jgi:hypothetical protein